MKVMLISSIRAKDISEEAIGTIVKAVDSMGHKCSHEHLSKETQVSLDAMSKEDNLAFHRSIIDQIKESDVVVSECSHESLSVGYLLSSAIDMGKPVVIFHHSSKPAPNIFPTLTETGKIFGAKYSTSNELYELVKEYVEYASEHIDVRFNFFISPVIGRYLDWVAKNKKIPRSVYLRTLIEQDMAGNDEYANSL